MKEKSKSQYRPQSVIERVAKPSHPGNRLCKGLSPLKAIFAVSLLMLLLPILAAAAPVGKITALEGNVDITVAGKVRPLHLNDPVNTGDILRTKANSKARVTFNDGNELWIAEKTRLKITQYQNEPGQKSFFNLFRGKTRSVLGNMAKKSVFEIHTPTAVCGVRGTIFISFFQSGQSGFVFEQGQGYGYNPKIPTQVVTIPAGQSMVVAAPEQAPVVKPATAAEIKQHLTDTSAATPAEGDGGGETEGSSEQGQPSGTSEGSSSGSQPSGSTEGSSETGQPSGTTEGSSSGGQPSGTSGSSSSGSQPSGTSGGSSTGGTTPPGATSQTGNYSAPPSTPTPPSTPAPTPTPTFTPAPVIQPVVIPVVEVPPDIVPPVVSITSTPPDLTNAMDATFSYEANEISNFEYRLDGGSWMSAGAATMTSSVTIPVAGDGTHTFELKATDALGNVSTPATYSWTTDFTAPAFTVSGMPSGTTNDTGATIGLTGEAGATYAYSIDAGDWISTDAAIILTDLTEGTHSLQIKATDALGNVADPLSYTWMIDFTSPTFTVSGVPSGTTNQQTANINLSGEAGTTYSYSLDSETWIDTGSTIALTGLTEGTHSLQIKATDASGNASDPLSYTWMIDFTSPTFTVSGVPSGTTNQKTANINLSGDAGTTYSYSLDSETWINTGETIALLGLTEGTHNLQIKATDASGNVSDISSFSWSVDTQGPSLAFTSTSTNAANASFTFSMESGATYTYSLDGGSATASGGSIDLIALGTGAHTITVYGTDAAGNTTTISYTWSVEAPAPPLATATTFSAPISGVGGITGTLEASFTGAIDTSSDTGTLSLTGNIEAGGLLTGFTPISGTMADNTTAYNAYFGGVPGSWRGIFYGLYKNGSYIGILDAALTGTVVDTSITTGSAPLYRTPYGESTESFGPVLSLDLPAFYPAMDGSSSLDYVILSSAQIMGYHTTTNGILGIWGLSGARETYSSIGSPFSGTALFGYHNFDNEMEDPYYVFFGNIDYSRDAVGHTTMTATDAIYYMDAHYFGLFDLRHVGNYIPTEGYRYETVSMGSFKLAPLAYSGFSEGELATVGFSYNDMPGAVSAGGVGAIMGGLAPFWTGNADFIIIGTHQYYYEILPPSLLWLEFMGADAADVSVNTGSQFEGFAAGFWRNGLISGNGVAVYKGLNGTSGILTWPLSGVVYEGAGPLGWSGMWTAEGTVTRTEKVSTANEQIWEFGHDLGKLNLDGQFDGVPDSYIRGSGGMQTTFLYTTILDEEQMEQVVPLRWGIYGMFFMGDTPFRSDSDYLNVGNIYGYKPETVSGWTAKIGGMGPTLTYAPFFYMGDILNGTWDPAGNLNATITKGQYQTLERRGTLTGPFYGLDGAIEEIGYGESWIGASGGTYGVDTTTLNNAFGGFWGMGPMGPGPIPPCLYRESDGYAIHAASENALIAGYTKPWTASAHFQAMGMLKYDMFWDDTYGDYVTNYETVAAWQTNHYLFNTSMYATDPPLNAVSESPVTSGYFEGIAAGIWRQTLGIRPYYYYDGESQTYSLVWNDSFPVSGDMNGSIRALAVTPEISGSRTLKILKSDNVAGPYFPGIGMWTAEGDIAPDSSITSQTVASTDNVQIQYRTTQYIYLRGAFDEAPLSSRIGISDSDPYSYGGGTLTTAYFEVSDNNMINEPYSPNWGIYSLMIPANDGITYGWYQDRPLTGGPWTWSAVVGGEGLFGYYEYDPMGSYGYWLATVRGDWSETGEITGTLGKIGEDDSTFGVFVTRDRMGIVGGPYYGIDVSSSDGYWIGQSIGVYNGTPTDFGGWAYPLCTLYNDSGSLEWDGDGEGAFGLVKRMDGNYDFLAVGLYYDYGSGMAGFGGPYIWSGPLQGRPEFDRDFGGFNAGILKKSNPNDTFGTMGGYAAAVYYDIGDVIKAGLIRGNAGGHFYELDYDSEWEEMYGVWKLTSDTDGLTHVDKTVSLPADINSTVDIYHGYFMNNETAGTFDGGEGSTTFNTLYGGGTKFLTYTSGVIKSVPFGVYNFKLGDLGLDYGDYTGRPAGPSAGWNAIIGGEAEFSYEGNSYWYAQITGSWDDYNIDTYETDGSAGHGTITGWVDGSYLSSTQRGSLGGLFYGLYTSYGDPAEDGTWIGMGIGTFEGEPLAFVSDVRNPPLPPFISSISNALMGGVMSLWNNATVDVSMMGRYTSTVFPSIWYSTDVFSHNYFSGFHTTYETGTDPYGAYYGYLGGILIPGVLKDPAEPKDMLGGRFFASYVDSNGNAGYLGGNLGGEGFGEGYPEIGILNMTGAINRIQMETGVGISPADLYGSVTPMSFPVPGLPPVSNFILNSEEIVTPGGNLVSVQRITALDRGAWQTILSGIYTTPPGDSWTASYDLQEVAPILFGMDITGTQWSGNKITALPKLMDSISQAAAIGYGADTTYGPYTWISVGEVIGTYDPTNAFKMIAMGPAIGTVKFLDMVNSNPNALKSLSIPCINVGMTNITGTAGDTANWAGNALSVNLNDVTFFSYSAGGTPKIWATGSVGGNFGGDPVALGEVPLSIGAETVANFTAKQWNNVAGGSWIGKINGSGTSFTLNEPPVSGNHFTGNVNIDRGAAAGVVGTAWTAPPPETPGTAGTFTGTAAGIAK